ncbi:putative cupin superfamily protein [Roseibium hamelinense]|uniref:Putative cupin superfamily protein n=1 Tax=Roseibium hamelinense TaxID=150831 RepID=A0A562T271_9HYPH|nr:cupin domain-containing protein [Roseibium hamelinense]MTI44485.1 cupin domain-containing protein [Roseibium hamelinense]TWI87453.1 putative cupin superfamily protein [Roseibium hamelinense]
MTKSPILNIEEVLAQPDMCDENPERGKFQARFGFIGRALGTQQIGVNVTIVPPGKAAWPRHFHYINDEMFIILSGSGTLHYGEEDYPFKPMDVIHIEAGTGIPFQIHNTSETELRYLALSTLDPADVFVYPDSNKIGIMAKAAPFRDLAGDDGLPAFRKWVTTDMSIGYWEGEPDV